MEEELEAIAKAVAEAEAEAEAEADAAKRDSPASPGKTLMNQLSQLTDGVRNTLEFPSRLLPRTPQLPGRPDGIPIGARQYVVGCVDDLWHARPTVDKPYPVVLLHGSISSKNAWQNLVVSLRDRGWVVFAPDYGMHGTQDVTTSAQDVAAYIDQVLEATGADEVDVVGHSQGGLLARYWINEMDGADKVHHLVTLSSPHHGTTVRGLLASVLTASETTARVAEVVISKMMGPAGLQQAVGSPLIETMTAGRETRPGIRYSCLATRNDTTVLPFETAFLAEDSGDGPGGPAKVWNAFMQDHGVGRVRHDEVPSNPEVQELVMKILEEGLDDGLDD